MSEIRGDAITNGSVIPENLSQLRQLVHTNLVTDVVAQVAVLIAAVLLRSGWMWALFGIRWVVVAALLISRSLFVRGSLDRGLMVLGGGHALGVIATVAVGPQLAPIGLLILTGDMLLTAFSSSAYVRPQIYLLVVSMTLVAALSFQNWTTLRDEVPTPVALAFLITHTLGSGIVIPRSHRLQYALLKRSTDRLLSASRRQGEAIRDEQTAIMQALTTGPLNDLRAIEGSLDEIEQLVEIDTALAADRASAAASEAQAGLRSLRAISHGIFPDSLRYGIDAAVASLGDPRIRVHVESGRLESELEAAIYGLITQVAKQVPRDGILDVQVGSTTFGKTGYVTVDCEARAPVDSDGIDDGSGPTLEVDKLSPVVLDRLGALDAEFMNRPAANQCLSVIVPRLQASTDSAVPVAAPAVSKISASPVEEANAAILSLFVRWAGWVGSIALGASTVVLLATRTKASLIVWFCLCMLRVALYAAHSLVRSQRYSLSVATLCLTTAIAAPFLTALEFGFGAATSLAVTLPLLLGLPHFTQRTLDQVAAVQALALTAIVLIVYFETPLLPQVVPTVVPLLVIPLISGCLALMTANTMFAIINVLHVTKESARRVMRTTSNAADDHRRSIERNLHDGAQQQFVALSMQFRLLAKQLTSQPVGHHQASADRQANLGERLIAIRSLCRETGAELLLLSQGAVNQDIGEGRLADGLGRVAQALGQPVSLEVTDVEVVSPAVAATVYFCCIEAMNNAIKHAGPGAAIEVKVWATESHVHFSVCDDGLGFVIGETTMHGHDGKGFTSIRERMTAHRGMIAVDSAPGKGTSVEGSLPRR